MIALRAHAKWPVVLVPTCRRHLHSQARLPASVDAWIGTGSPPPPPPPALPADIAREERDWWLARRRRHAASLCAATESRKRFWRHVDVRPDKNDAGSGSLDVWLDERPLRHPTTKRVVQVPLSKRVLAFALAAEWDQLTATAQAARGHLVPLTSLVCRALEILDDDDDALASTCPPARIRTSIVDNVMRYLDTDSILCWEPSSSPSPSSDRMENNADADDRARLREKQIAAFEAVAGPLMHPDTGAWARAAGVKSLRGVLDPDGGLFPRGQAEGVRDAVERWVVGLDAWELAGLERATLAGKSLVTAARLVVDWSEGPAGRGRGRGEKERLGAEDAARATSVEVDWQVGRWGEVQDSHDVDREDVRRHFGSVVLLVSGTGSKALS